GLRVRVQEYVQVVERRLQAQPVCVEHAVAEHVACHVADAGSGERVLLHVDTQLTEVAGNGLPRAAGGDPLRLVVVAVRAAGSEGVTEPETVLGGGRVGQVGERGGTFVGRVDQVRVSPVPDDQAGRVDGF